MIAPAMLAMALLGRPAAPAPSLRPAVIAYTVRPGDTLWAIAGRDLGDGKRWPVIYDGNRVTIGADPGLIYPGQKIRVILPERDHALESRDRADGNVGKRTVSSAVPPAGGSLNAQRPAGGIYSGQLSCTGLENLWKTAGGDPRAAFLAAEIAMAESGGRQYALSPTDDYGYWQVNAAWGPLATFDALGNARAAVIISRDGTDWLPWTTYRTGAYARRC